MNISISKNPQPCEIFFVFEQENSIYSFTQKHEKLLSHLRVDFFPKEFSSFSFSQDNTLFFAIKLKKDFSTTDIKKSSSVIYDLVTSHLLNSVVVFPPDETKEVAKSFMYALEVSEYTFDKYKSKKKDFELSLNLATNSIYEKYLQDLQIEARQVKFTRNLVNENASVMTPQKLEDLAKVFAREHKLKIKCLSEKLIEKEGLGLLHAVGQGAKTPPRLIILEYKGAPGCREKIALVGKGITFDTGGINLKPSGHIESMKCDMAGAATVFGAFKAAVEMRLKKNLVLVMAAAENSIGSGAFLPGEILTSYNNTSVEVKNTDAEGRLVLADAISYVQQHFFPTKIIDLATLTGASIVALGPKLIAGFSNSDEFFQKIFSKGELTDERVWRLPIYEEHREMIKSELADISNLGTPSRSAGASTAAAFLEHFIEKGVEWAHLDIAAAAYRDKQDFYVPKFASGTGVSLLVELLKEK